MFCDFSYLRYPLVRVAIVRERLGREVKNFVLGKQGRTLKKGEIIDRRFAIQEPLAAGTMSNIHLALDTHTEKRVVIKMMKPTYSPGDLTVASRPFLWAPADHIERETRALARLNHRNIVRMISSGTHAIGLSRVGFIAQEHLEGKTLAEVISSRITWVMLRSALIQICDALDSAHRNGVAHGDLKPENIFLTNGNGDGPIVKVFDFGLAKFDEDFDYRWESREWAGPYMAPEQRLGRTCTRLMDIYSVGMILLTGIIGKVLDSIYAHTLPRDIENIVRIATDWNPSRRFQSAIEIRNAIEAASV